MTIAAITDAEMPTKAATPSRGSYVAKTKTAPNAPKTPSIRARFFTNSLPASDGSQPYA